MTLPLTLAMSINVLFIFGAVFIPGLWSVVEYLFPFAILAFALVWVLALKIFSEYFTRIIVEGFDFTQNNNLSQMIAVFAFSMIGVGFAASAAMSTNQTTIAVAMIGSLFFVTLTIFFGALKLILGFKSMLRHGLAVEASPTFWVMIPILTLLGITYVRLQHGIHAGLEMHTETGSLFIVTTIILSLQLIFGYLGYKVMRANKYFITYLSGDKKSPGSYALICPWVALVVFAFFFLHLGLVKNGVVDKFSLIYFLLLIPVIYLQIKTIITVFILNKKLLNP